MQRASGKFHWLSIFSHNTSSVLQRRFFRSIHRQREPFKHYFGVLLINWNAEYSDQVP
jgi:hypothetical protein